MEQLVKKKRLRVDQWPGWPIHSHSFNGEFDMEARARMVRGSRELLVLLYEYAHMLNKTVLEVGPFFNPLSHELQHTDLSITFWENDEHAYNWLNTTFAAQVVRCNIEEIGTTEFMSIQKNNPLYNTVILSQIFNYIDYKQFILHLREFLNNGCLLFVNNVIHYGLTDFFSEERPQSIEDTIKNMEDQDFKLLKYQILRPPTPNDDNRLIAVFKYQKDGITV